MIEVYQAHGSYTIFNYEIITLVTYDGSNMRFDQVLFAKDLNQSQTLN